MMETMTKRRRESENSVPRKWYSLDEADQRTGAGIIELMTDLNREAGTTLVLVTHDPELAGRARRILRLADGRLVSDTAA